LLRKKVKKTNWFIR